MKKDKNILLLAYIFIIMVLLIVGYFVFFGFFTLYDSYVFTCEKVLELCGSSILKTLVFSGITTLIFVLILGKFLFKLLERKFNR